MFSKKFCDKEVMIIKMKEYIYKFADGTKSTVEVSDELYKKLRRQDKDEYNNWQRENRRHVSLDEMRDNGIDIPVFDEYTFGELFANLHNDELSDVIQNLGKKQKELLYAVFYERKKLKEIAREQKVTSAAICIRLRTTLLQLGTKK